MKKYANIKTFLLFSVIVLIVIFSTKDFNNLFGSTTDWLSQHIVFPDYFRTLFYETKNLTPNFAFNIGAGQNIYYFSYYGLLNPYILISYFLPFISMTTYIIILNILIVIVSGFLFYKWLVRNNFNYRIAVITGLVFLLIAPLIFHAHRHFMFINYMPFLILGLMGIDDYFENKKRWFYTISTFLMIMTSYYYSIGGLLVLIIYGIYKYLKLNNKINIKSFIKDGLLFLIPIIIAVLMACIILIPTFMAIISGRTGNISTFNINDLLMPYFNIGALLYSSYTIGFTSIALIALISPFINIKKERLFLSITIIILLVIPIFAYLLNGTLYIRSKVFIPFAPLIGLLIVTFFNDLELNKFSIKKMFALLLGLNILAILLDYKEMIFYCDMIITSIVLLISIYQKKMSLLYGVVIMIAFISAITANQNENYANKDSYNYAFNNNGNQLIEKIISEDNSFYRMNNLIGNTGITCNKIFNARYYQTSLYSSTHNAYYQNFFNNIAFNAIPHRNSIIAAQTNNIMFQTLMGVKYIISNDNIPIGYDKIDSNGRISLYKNNNVFPLGYATSSLIDSKTFDKFKYPYNLEALLNSIVVETNTNDRIESNIKLFNPDYQYINNDAIDINKTDSALIIDTKRSSNLILKLNETLKNKILFIQFNLAKAPSCRKGDISITINDVTNKLTCRSWIYFNNNYSFEYVLSSPNEIKNLDINFTKGHFEIKDMKLYTLDYSYVQNISSTIDSFIVDTNKTTGDKIVGNIKVNKDGYFATTIPYDKGFTILVNDQKIEYEKVNKAFIGFPIKKGDYQIEMIYKAPGAIIGKVVSMIGFILFILIIVIDVRKKAKYEVVHSSSLL
jgi:uncharacterized membrane protein YfhO